MTDAWKIKRSRPQTHRNHSTQCDQEISIIWRGDLCRGGHSSPRVTDPRGWWDWWAVLQAGRDGVAQTPPGPDSVLAIGGRRGHACRSKWFASIHSYMASQASDSSVSVERVGPQEERSIYQGFQPPLRSWVSSCWWDTSGVTGVGGQVRGK